MSASRWSLAAARDWPISRWARAHPVVVDSAIAIVLLAYALVAHWVFRDTVTDVVFRDPSWWTVALIVASTVPLAVRRQHAIAVALVVVAAQILMELANINATGWFNVVVAIYSLGAYAHGRPRTGAVITISVAVVALLVLGTTTPDEVLTAFEAVGSAAILVTAFVLGDNIRRRRNEVQNLAQRAERAERERELLAGQRVVEERARIARDLHDVVAHSVSVMVVQATAARRNVARDPAAAASLLTNVEASGRRAMGELRQILGVLREPHDDEVVTAVLTDVETLVGSIPGLDVRYESSGSLAEVPPGVALSAYRLIQEALTNTHRHAGPGVTVDVVVTCSPERVDVTVLDDGRGASTRAAARDPSAGDGYGLVGMHERVAAFGGQLRAGPRRAGGWEVRAWFPLTPSS